MLNVGCHGYNLSCRLAEDIKHLLEGQKGSTELRDALGKWLKHQDDADPCMDASKKIITLLSSQRELSGT